jgi:hypothetical protein
MEINVEKTKEVIEKQAEKADISKEKVKALYDERFKFYKKRGLDDKQADERALVRVKAALKKKNLVIGGREKVLGFVLAKSSAYDKSRKAEALAREKVEIWGKEKAIREGYMNAAEELLYVEPEWLKGKVIEPDWRANGVAIIERNDKTKVANVEFRDRAATEDFDTFKACELSVFVKKEHETRYDVIISTLPEACDDKDINYFDYLAPISEGAKILTKLSELDAFEVETKEEFASWCIVEGNVIEIRPVRGKKTVVRVDDASLDEKEAQEETIPVFFPPNSRIQFTEEALEVVFIGSPFRDRDGKVALSCWGYWIDPDDRVDNSNLRTPEIDDAWGLGGNKDD